jgi:hypothetical protein
VPLTSSAAPAWSSHRVLTPPVAFSPCAWDRRTTHRGIRAASPAPG